MATAEVAGDLQIDEVFKSLIPPLSPEEAATLEESIRDEGCRDAIVTWNGVIIDGHNRYSICLQHGIPFRTIEREFPDRESVMIWMIDNQRGRRNLTTFVKTELGLRKAELLEPKARENQGARTDLFQNSEKGCKPVDTTRAAAEYANVSHDTASRVKKIRDASPEIADSCRRGEMSVNEAYRKVKAAERQAAVVASVDVPLQTEDAESTPPFSIIYADPPWSYNDKATSGGHWAGAENHYPCMTIDQLCEMTVDFGGKPYHISEIAADNAVLFLWVTFPLLDVCFRVIEAWGFEYKTCGFTWMKTNKDGSPYMGLGNYTRQNTELCLLGRRGNALPRQNMGVSSVLVSPKTKHSAKPEEARSRIVDLYGDVPRIELFARESVPGWAHYGNQVQQRRLYA